MRKVNSKSFIDLDALLRSEDTRKAAAKGRSAIPRKKRWYRPGDVPESRVHDDFIGCRRLASRVVANALLDVKRMRDSRYYKSGWRYAYDWVLSPDFEWWCGEVLGMDASSLRVGIVAAVKENQRKKGLTQLWQHEETGRTCMLLLWQSSPGRRWYRVGRNTLEGGKML